MPNAADLVTTAEVTARLTSLTADQITALPSVITGLSKTFEQYCHTVLAKQTIDEIHHPEVSRKVWLRNIPVVSVARVCTSGTGVLKITYTGSTFEATVQLVTTGNVGNQTVSSIKLNRMSAGVLAADATLTIASYPTASLMAAAINAVSGWTATVGDGLDGFPMSRLAVPQGQYSALDGGCDLRAWTKTLNDWALLSASQGELLLPSAGGENYAFPSRTWGLDPRANGVRITYEAGYETVPEDLKEAAITGVSWLQATNKISGLYQKEQWPDYSYELKQTTESTGGNSSSGDVMPSAIIQVLANYMNVQLV